jgi:hypothetical protein
MVALHEASKAPICTASVTLVRVDGTVMPVAGENDGKRHVDTSAIFVTREAFPLLPMWALVPKELAQMGDRVWWQLAKSSGYPRVHCTEPTVFYRTRYAATYRALGEPLPADAKEMEELPAGSIKCACPRWEPHFKFMRERRKVQSRRSLERTVFRSSPGKQFSRPPEEQTDG